MKCPYCNSKVTNVIDTRDSGEGNIIRRRRRCIKCKKRFTTFEKVETLDLIVVKKDGRRERFDRYKIISGITRACEKRPISQETIKKIADKIEAKLRTLHTTEMPSSIIGEYVMKSLKNLDKVAYIRFASVYRSFADVESFEQELKRLIKKK